jgi:hypothetical protein
MRNLSPALLSLFISATIGALLIVLCVHVLRRRNAVWIGAAAIVMAVFVPPVIMSIFQPSAQEAARSALENHGFKLADFELRRIQGSNRWASAESVVIYQKRGVQPAKYVRVTLTQPMFFRPWEVSEMREEDRFDP